MPSNYWNDRNIRTQARLQNKSVAEIEKEQARLYKSAMKQTIKDFESTYNSYLRQVAEGQTPSPALLYNMDKYWQMQADLRERSKALGDKEVEMYSKKFEALYEDVYRNTSIPSADSFSTISAGNAEQVVNQVWCADGKSWSSRVWNNQAYLQRTLNNQLMYCTTTGSDPAKLVRLLSERFDVARHRANTLVRTEMAHITTQAAKNRYLDYGLEEYEFLADPDERTCEECAELDGKRFKLSEMDAGVNAPPIHPNDRCTIIPVIPNEGETPVEEEAPMVEAQPYDTVDAINERILELEERMANSLDFNEWVNIEQEREALTVKRSELLKTEKTERDAKRIAEIETKFKSGYFIDDSSKFITQYDLSGVDVKCAESILSAYDKVFERYPQFKGKFSGIMSSDMLPNFAAAETSKYGGVVSVSKTHFGDYDTLAKKCLGNFEDGSTTPRNPEEMIIHELGHAISMFSKNDWTTAEGYSQMIQSDSTIASTVKRAVDKEVGTYVTSQEISTYATTNDNEWFAESFTLYMTGRTDSAVIKSFGKNFEKIVGKVK